MAWPLTRLGAVAGFLLCLPALMQKSLEVALLSVLALSLVASPAFGIRNGEPVRRGEFLPVGRLNRGCTATLVAPDIILTAAHCVRKDPGRNEFEIEGQEPARGVELRILSTDNPAELAVIKLDRGFDVDGFYPFWKKPLKRGATATAVGYGNTGGEAAESPGLDAFVPGKFSGQLKFSGSEKMSGKRISGRDLENDAPMLRFEPADGRRHLPLRGDSGGPVLVEENGVTYFAGVASFIMSGGDLPTTEENARLVYYIPVRGHCDWLLGVFGE